ncbi:thiamine phosphate synthase [Parasphingopyxis sp.]|uniref:thiamine phosphate synthase n=1 Tax=Parasphingopyxis sp. TaxID=1920299 RepID=UPI0026296ED8|nr:thiamine phosphate synthase [Parasphingopyxis sp.]
MRRGHPLPRLWMMTDERQGESLWPALKALPRGSGVIARHYSLAPRQRRRLIARIRKIARARRLVLIVAGSAKLARSVRADGFHRRTGHRTPRDLLRTVAVHNQIELRLAERIGANLVFLSPIFPTDSHPGGRTLGRVHFGQLATRSHIPVIALGGMDAARARSLRTLGLYGWAAIGALTPARN